MTSTIDAPAKMSASDRKAKLAAMRVVSDTAEAMAILDHEPGYVALDLETSGLHYTTDRIAVVAMYGPASNTAAILHYRGEGIPKALADWLSVPGRKLINHNGTGFDLAFLASEGVAYRAPEWYDTMIGEQAVLTGGRKDVRVNLKDTLARRLGVAIPKDVDHATWMLPTLDDQQMRYLADDIFYLPLLHEAQLAKAAELDEKHQREGWPGVRDSLAFEQRLAPIVAGMGMRGLPIDLDALHDYHAKQEAAMPAHEAWLRARLGNSINLNHSPTVRNAANKAFDLDLDDTRKDTLALIADDAPSPEACASEAQEFAYRLLRYRHATKRESMYDEGFETKFVRAGRLFGTFRQLGTDTGRFSSWNPNLQQLPRDMRHVITDPTGELAIVAADYSAIEVRVAADLYQDEALLAALADEDIHSTVASLIFGEMFTELEPQSPERKELRRIAKASSFTYTFGGGFRRTYNYARANGSRASYDEIERSGRAFLNRFKGVERARTKAFQAIDRGLPLAIWQPTGLLRWLVPGTPTYKGTTFLNNTVQGTAAAGLKHALLLMDERGISQYLAAVVHDEIVTTPPRAIASEVSRVLSECMIEGMSRVTDAPVAVEAKGDMERWG
jgi:DNA polymerase I-like protein with 3'-5' exonuclease and polymerase domains